jgi:hypothetical protein
MDLLHVHLVSQLLQLHELRQETLVERGVVQRRLPSRRARELGFRFPTPFELRVDGDEFGGLLLLLLLLWMLWVLLWLLALLLLLLQQSLLEQLLLLHLLL